MRDVFEDEQYRASDDIIEVDDPDLGPTKTPAVLPKLSRTPGEVDHLGPAHGEYNEAVYCGELGPDRETLAEPREAGVV